MTCYAYTRCSTDKQTLENQRFEIENFCKKNGYHIDKWVEETISSRKPLSKRLLGELVKEINTGDIIITCEVSRIGRSLLEVMSILQKCLEKNCQVITIKENYHLGNDIQSKVLAFAFTITGEIERQLISQRTIASLNRLKAEGKKLGRPLGATSKALKLAKNQKRLIELLDKKVPKSQIARALKINRSTLYRFIQNTQN